VGGVPTRPAPLDRVLQVAAYTVVLVLAAELAIGESFLVGARVLGEPLPVAAIVAGVANVLLGRTGGRLVAASWGAIVPGLLWLLVVFPLGISRSEGDLIVTGDLRGFALLVAGSLGVVIGASTARATPSVPNGR
jgi:hypothetical protein